MEWGQVFGVTGAGSGSGYLIAPRLVLTSAHVVGENGTAVSVYRPGKKNTFSGLVVWRGTSGGRDDAALVHLEDPRWTLPALTPVVWGRTVTYQPGIACRTWGLPQFVQRTGQHADVEQPSGTLNPGDRIVSDRYVVHFDAYPPSQPSESQSGSPWAGMSGAAVYCGNLLAGVVVGDPAGRQHAGLEAVPAYVLLHDKSFRETVAKFAGDGSLSLEPIELQQLMDRQSPLRTSPMASTPATLLTARRAIVSFRGRGELLSRLHAWTEQSGLGVWLLHGPGGQGKTRVAHCLGETLADQGWTVLWLDPSASVEQMHILTQVSGKLLVIVDYAETRPAQVTSLFNELGTRLSSQQVKILLLARTEGGWWHQLGMGGDTVAEIRDAALKHALPPLDRTPEDRRDTYTAAVSDFAQALPLLRWQDHVRDWPAIAAEVVAMPPEFRHETTALGMHMHALIDLLDAVNATSRDRERPNTIGSSQERPLEDRILDHERSYWMNSARTRGLVPHLGIETLTDIVTATAVLAPVDIASLEAALQHIPELADQPRITMGKIRDWLMSLYPGQSPGRFGGLAPDRIAEQLVRNSITDLTRPCLIEALAATAELPQAEHLLTVCARAVAHSSLTSEAGHQLTRWCTQHPDRLLPAAIYVATQVEEPGPLLAALEHIVEAPSADVSTLMRLSDTIPPDTQVLATVALALGQAVVARLQPTKDQSDRNKAQFAKYLGDLTVRLRALGQHEEALALVNEVTVTFRALAERQPEHYLPHLATSYFNLAGNLSALGQLEEGLNAATRSVGIFRQLAEQRPEQFLPKLASSLNNLAERHGSLSRREEALAAADEAVQINQQLAQKHPEAFLFDLATSLSVLASSLSALGARDESLSAARDVVTIRRQLAKHHPDAHTPALATSLNNLAKYLGDVGLHDEELNIVSEAVQIRRWLAEQRPAAFLGDLGTSLTNLANCLGEVGQYKEGLAAGDEATTIFRSLAEQRPEAYLPDLASSLVNGAIRLSDMHKDEEALAACREAVSIYRQLAEDRPEVYRPHLAISLNNLSSDLNGLGAPEEGLLAADEATAILRALADQLPEVYLPHLGLSLNNLGNQLGDLHRYEQGLDAAQEAVEVFRRLVEHRRNLFLPNLASCLNNLANRLSQLERHEEGIDAANETVQTYRELAGQRPDVYLTYLARSLNTLAIGLSDSGRHGQAFASATEAVDIWEELAESDPSMHSPNLEKAQLNLIAIAAML
ncbi:tetratricopeptide repeat protein [Nocardia uniformis]|uniref:Tetratricopeptide repeat protein n=2 Tax=Nocardia uniformis TaxID=53432 RepID=A0A849CI45_9NOCA|nr:tetratricopeptide repeat protein [Nocardia uniformis]NNH75849.1 tetratricopeptide repeat protein [Nocardia uniformis]